MDFRLGIKRPKRGTDQLPSSHEDQEQWSYTTIRQYVFVVQRLIKETDKFIHI
jgi:hypothetical protein